MVSTLLDAGLLFLLRFALDDSVEGVMSTAVHALKALLVCAEDEVRQLEVLQRVCLVIASFYLQRLIEAWLGSDSAECRTSQ